MSDALSKGMVLVMSLWSDSYASMLWLDSTFPPEKAGQPGSERGDCPTSSGKAAQVQSEQPNAQVTFSNIKFGDIGSTFNSGEVSSSSGSSSSSREEPAPPASAPAASAPAKGKTTAPKTVASKGKGGKQPKTGVKFGSAPEEWSE
jgi:cellulose 1,4-beta-cellobiosidase